MTPLVPLVLFGWIPVVLALFLLMEPRRAAVSAFLFAWLFLPNAGYQFIGLPDYTKVTAACAGVFLAMVFLDPDRPLLRIRWGWIDLPMLVWCILPFFTSLSNDLGAYDGMSSVMNQMVSWGLPYIIGRAYFSDLQGARELAMGLFIGGLVYVPLCLIEIQLSPQLHNWLYGYHAHAFIQTRRWGGYRPVVFMHHGLMLGLFMSTASLIGVWFWQSRMVKQLLGIPISVLVPALLITTVLCKSAGALMLLVMGLCVMFAAKYLRSTWVLIALVLVPPVYFTGRVTELWTGHELIGVIEALVGEARASSLEYRLDNEVLLVERAQERPLLGWGGWNRHRVVEDGTAYATTDSLWVITFGTYGITGLVLLYVLGLLPVYLLARRLPRHLATQTALAPVMALCITLVLYMYDNILNAMVNPTMMLVAGGLAGLAVRRIEVRSSKPGAPVEATPPSNYPLPQDPVPHPPGTRTTGGTPTS